MKHKKPGTELRFLKGRYYLYEVSSKWNKEKKRAQKITGKILGRITEDNGFVPSGNRPYPTSQLKEFSAKSSDIGPFVKSLFRDVLSALKKHFGTEADSIFCASLIRLAHQSPLKNMEHHFKQDYLSETFSAVSLSDKKMTNLLRDLGWFMS